MVSIRTNQTDFPGADLLVDMILFGANYSSLARFSVFPDIPLYDVVCGPRATGETAWHAWRQRQGILTYLSLAVNFQLPFLKSQLSVRGPIVACFTQRENW